MRRKITSIRWREKGADDDFVDFGETFKYGTIRKYRPPEKGLGAKYEANIHITDGPLHSKLQAFRTDAPERLVELKLDVEGMEDPVVMESRVKMEPVSSTPPEYQCEFTDCRYD